MDWTSVIFNDPVGVKDWDIVAVHGYLDGVNATTGIPTGWTRCMTNASSVNKPSRMSETSGYNDAWISNPGAFQLAKSIYLALKYGNISGWAWWSIAGGNAPYCLTDAMGNPTTLYYVSKNYYRYIRPGALQIQSSSVDTAVYVLAFKNPGSSVYSAVKPQFTVVLINDNASVTKTVSLSGRTLSSPLTMQGYRSSSSQNCVSLGSISSNNISLPPNPLQLWYTNLPRSPLLSIKSMIRP